MANAAGGIIVYGIAEGPLGEADYIDIGCNPKLVKPEWIDQVLTSGIEPRISGVIIQPITLSTGNRVFAIEIPQATSLAPHQARNQRRYFKRTERRVKSMLDYEIKDLMRRGNTPELFVTFEIHSDSQEHFLKAYVGNKSSEPALYSMVSFAFDNELNVQIPGAEKLPLEVFLASNGISRPANVSTLKMGIPGYFPIFKEAIWNLFDIKITVEDNKSYPFQYSIRCPGFELTRSGSINCMNGSFFMSIKE